MNRFLSDKHIRRVTKDFAFLVKKVRQSRGELDFRLRQGYFNLYYKGNSLAKITPRRGGYEVKIHEKFIPGGFFEGDTRFHKKGARRGNNRVFRLEPSELKPFFQAKYLSAIGSNIARVNSGEEITFEQLLVTDNLEREDFFILDRQVTETALNRSRIDLLGATQVGGNRYQFVVVEVKLGSNPELEGKVHEQLSAYVTHIEDNFIEWKPSYEQTYRQLKALGLFDIPHYESIEVVEGVHSTICVGGYTGLAQQAIAKLKAKYPDATVQLFRNRVQLEQLTR